MMFDWTAFIIGACAGAFVVQGAHIYRLWRKFLS